MHTSNNDENILWSLDELQTEISWHGTCMFIWRIIDKTHALYGSDLCASGLYPHTHLWIVS